MNLRTHFAVLFTLAAASLLGGCTHYRTSALPADDRGTLEATHYQAEITATDGKKIRFTVWQPTLHRGQTAPLVLHAHGFALTRMDSKLDMYAQYLLAGTAARSAWEHGYWVISYDQRGHGASGGTVGMQEWDKEVADVSLLIDWAQKNLALTAVDGDPKVGMIGESYGGGVQLLATVSDPRIDAIVPLTTWYDLQRSLIPNGVPKSEWALFLGAAGYAINPFHMDGKVTVGMFKEVIMNEPQPMLRQRLHRNSLASHCEGGDYPHADALLIQGFRDVVFPMNEALDMRECFLKAGRDVRLIGVEHGHLAPTAQLSPRLPIWNVDPTVRCNGRSYDLKAMILNWFDLKLRDKRVPDSAVPTWCMTGDRAVDAAMAMPPGVDVDVAEVHVGSGASGLVEWIARPLESAKNWFVPNRMPKDWDTPSNGWLRPARVPLLRIDGPTWVVGVPHVELSVTDTDRTNPILFLRLAVWKPGSGNYRVLSQQVTPIRGKGALSVDLDAVRRKLNKGEVLGLLVNGYSNQYRLAGSGWGTDASISGTIKVPMAAASK